MNIAKLIKSIIRRKLENGISFSIDLPSFYRNDEIKQKRRKDRIHDK